LGLASWLSDEGQEWFQGLMALVACALVVQMVLWMRRHGRGLKRELEAGAADQVDQNRWWGLLALVMIAVAREGSEAVVFLYGAILSSAASGQVGSMVLAGLGGFAAALLTFWLLQLGGKIITWRRFFKCTEVLLLLLASALLVAATDRFISLDVLPALVDPIWDTSWLLNTEGGLGKILADFAAYRATPALSQVLIWLAFWLVVVYLLRWAARPLPPARRAATPAAVA